MKAVKPVAAIVVVALLAFTFLGFFYRANQGDLLVTDATASSISGQPGAIGVFLTIHNSGGPDRLVAARTIVAQRSWLESSVADAGLAIPANSKPSLSPDGAFILLDGIGGDLKEGRLIPLTLRFEQGGEIRTQARLTSPREKGAAGTFGLFGIGDICTVGEGEPAPEIKLEVTPDGDGWIVRVIARDFTFSKDMVDGPHVPGTGHGHLYLGGLKLQRLYEPEIRIGALPAGVHELRVTLNTNDHRAYVVKDSPVTATAEIIVR